MSTIPRSRSHAGPSLRLSILMTAIVVVALVLPCSAASPGSETSLSATPEQLVETALRHELSGNIDQRNRLLEEALLQAPDSQPARWHSGQVRYGDAWTSIDDVPVLSRSDPRYQEYLRIRSGYRETASGQMELATWCGKRRLNDQARAHLTQVLQLDPDHVQAHRKLGHRRMAGEWIPEQEFQQLRERERVWQKNLSKWKPKVRYLRQELIGNGAGQRKRAKGRLLEIREPAAIPALEFFLSATSEEEALLLVEVTDNMTDHAASRSLARQAVFSEWQPVRLAAAKKLRGRVWEAFVPQMLDTMFSPIQLHSQMEPGGNGTLIYRQLIFREGYRVKQEMTLDSVLGRGGLTAPVKFFDEGLALRGQQMLAQRRWELALHNGPSRAWNWRLAVVLNVVTDQQLSSRPQVWWDWWDRYNETLTGEKPAQRGYRSEQWIVISCFAAGTPVWTTDGPKPVEQIQVGDMVLSQNPNSGELCYKPVLRATERSAVELLTVQIGDQLFDCTGGHLFWSVGEGWSKARELAPETALHTVRGTARVEAVQPGPTKPTFNLVVADFNTYFVGQQKILVHDVTPREPTTTLVPGLKEL